MKVEFIKEIESQGKAKMKSNLKWKIQEVKRLKDMEEQISGVEDEDRCWRCWDKKKWKAQAKKMLNVK